MIVFTSINTGYLDKALVLAESVKRWHPEAEFHIVLADYQQGNEYINALVDHVETLDKFEFGQDKSFLFQHNVVELCTLLKPIYAAKLAQRHAKQHVVYLDPDTRLFAPLEPVITAHESAEVLLTPHLLTPPNKAADIVESEYSALQHGLYNLGFFSFIAGAKAERFLDWWANRLKHICSTVKENGLFTDQKIIDIAPIYFDFIGILKNKRLNVATWNLFERPLEYKHGQFLIEGEPLVFYHFTGFDSGAGQRKISAHHASNDALEQLWQSYQQQLQIQQAKVLGITTWCFANFDDGTPIPNAARQYYRFCIANKADFSNPFGASFQNLWRSSFGAKLFNQHALNAQPYLKTISSVNITLKDKLIPILERLKQATNKASNGRLFIWGFNEFGQQLEAYLYAQSLYFSGVFIVDKGLNKQSNLVDPNTVDFNDADCIVICAISAKNDIVDWIKAQHIAADVLSVAE
jgi:hypothetical protein